MSQGQLLLLPAEATTAHLLLRKTAIVPVPNLRAPLKRQGVAIVALAVVKVPPSWVIILLLTDRAIVD